MIFSNDKAIYVQIAERLSDEILAGKYKEDERIPSVREYAVLLEVNANTTVKAYDLLATDEIIYNKRGLGYFVSAGAKNLVYHNTMLPARSGWEKPVFSSFLQFMRPSEKCFVGNV